VVLCQHHEGGDHGWAPVQNEGPTRQGVVGRRKEPLRACRKPASGSLQERAAGCLQERGAVGGMQGICWWVGNL
jgi:hypothetical protein